MIVKLIYDSTPKHNLHMGQDLLSSYTMTKLFDQCYDHLLFKGFLFGYI